MREDVWDLPRLAREDNICVAKEIVQFVACDPERERREKVWVADEYRYLADLVDRIKIAVLDAPCNERAGELSGDVN